MFQTSSIFIICQMLAKLSGVESEGPYLSLEKGKKCVVFTYFIRRAREIRNF